MKTTQHFIGGDWRDGRGSSLTDVDPATGKPMAEISIAVEPDVDDAVRAARAAFDSGWRDSSVSERRKLLLRLATLVAEDAAELSRITTQDVGMPAAIAYGEAFYSAEYLEYFAGWPDKIHGDVIPVVAPKVLDYTLREPVGVVAAIVPWNAPLTLTIYKLAPALAAANTIVIKPSEHAPLAPLRLMELVARAGFPPGVVNCITGTGAGTGAALIEHPGVDKVAFTGGTETGRRVAALAGQHLKRVSLELGGKSANIVFADADLDAAATQAAVGCFLSSGQQCIGGSRLLVERRILDEFTDRVTAAARALVVGPPAELTTQLDRVLGYVDEARAGADVILGGERLGDGLGDGYYVGPTIVARATNEMRVAREEIFGPVLSVIAFDDEAQAIAIANDTPYGLAGAVWTNDLNKAHGVARAVRAGTVWVNSYMGVSPGVPFGGFKASGVGREGGKEAFDLYTETKNVYVQLK